MSYTRSYNETVSRTVSVDYPSSENGGSTSVTVDIPVDVYITVDTNTFDRNVSNCATNVELLTAAVVATETAEIVSKERNSHKVASSIIGGFFGYIRSGISQQIAELSTNVDAQLIHLKELMQSCISKKKQMQVDYNRISSRYLKIFEDLNNELSGRIIELDKQTFLFKKESDNQKIRTTENDLVNTVSIFGAESSDLHSKISASITKKRALDTILKSRSFLLQQKKMNFTIQQSMLNESMTGSIYAPLCYIEYSSQNKQNDNKIYFPSELTLLNDNKQKTLLLERFKSKGVTWKKISDSDTKKILLYFNLEVSNSSVNTNKHKERVMNMINKMVKLNDTQSVATIN